MHKLIFLKSVNQFQSLCACANFFYPLYIDAESTAKMVAVIKSMASFGRNAGGVAQTLLNCARNRDVHEKIPLAAITSLKQLPNELLSQVQVCLCLQTPRLLAVTS